MQIERAPQQATEPPSRPPRRSPTPTTRWLIARDENGRLEPLCVHEGAARVLPVFSFEEEAQMFLRLGGYEGAEGADGWRARQSCAGELVSVLLGPCLDAKGVALDPLPQMLEDGTIGLVWVGRKRFLGQLMASNGERTAS